MISGRATKARSDPLQRALERQHHIGPNQTPPSCLDVGHTLTAVCGNFSNYDTIGSTWSSQSTQIPTPLAEDLLPEQTAFLDAVTGPGLRSGNLALSCEWYTTFLKSEIEKAWTPLFQPVLVGICPSGCKPCAACFEIAFTFLKIMASLFHKKDLALVDFVDLLYNKDLLREADGDTEHDRSNAKQLVFAAFGWMSMLRRSQSIMLWVLIYNDL
jgi:hypothetical protein